MELFTVNEVSGDYLPIYITSEDVFARDICSMFRIILIESGTGIISINGKSMVFMAPTLICLNEKELIELEQENDIKARAIYFSPDIVNSLLTIENIRNNRKELIRTNNNDYFYLYPFTERSGGFIGMSDIHYAAARRISQLIDLIINEITTFENYYWPCRSRSFLLEILFFIQHIFTDQENDSKIQLVNSTTELNDIILYLHTNYSKKITIKELEKVFHINRTTLSKKFQDATDMTIKKYLIKLRIKVAAMMLRDTLLPISEIAYRVGFNDNTHFTRMFKKYFERLPSEYRDTMMNMP